MSKDEEFDFNSVDWSQLEHNFHADEHGNVPRRVVQTNVISPEMLAKRVLWDVVPCEIAIQTAKRLGLPPASEDVEDMEHQESHLRLTKAAVTAPFIQAMAEHATRAVVAAILEANDAEADDDLLNDQAERLEPMVFQSALAIIANLLDVGLLHLPHFGTVTHGGFQ